ncbi:MAG: copper chaperone PCu(A)C [Balneolaceae bacterium]|nr:copper chaperone PCu(A)C [Balneolaceae bacterium]
MISKFTHLLLSAFLLISILSCTSEQRQQSTEDIKQYELPSDGIEVAGAWARPGREAGVSAIYMNILNGSAQADTLTSISSPVAGMAEVHETYEQEEGMMGMRPAETVVLPARGSLSLKPGGLHVMLMQLNRELKEGDSIDFTIEFANGAEMTLSAPVQSMNR